MPCLCHPARTRRDHKLVTTLYSQFKDARLPGRMSDCPFWSDSNLLKMSHRLQITCSISETDVDMVQCFRQRQDTMLTTSCNPDAPARPLRMTLDVKQVPVSWKTGITLTGTAQERYISLVSAHSMVQHQFDCKKVFARVVPEIISRRSQRLLYGTRPWVWYVILTKDKSFAQCRGTGNENGVNHATPETPLKMHDVEAPTNCPNKYIPNRHPGKCMLGPSRCATLGYSLR